MSMLHIPFPTHSASAILYHSFELEAHCLRSHLSQPILLALCFVPQQTKIKCRGHGGQATSYAYHTAANDIMDILYTPHLPLRSPVSIIQSRPLRVSTQSHLLVLIHHLSVSSSFFSEQSPTSIVTQNDFLTRSRHTKASEKQNQLYHQPCRTPQPPLPKPTSQDPATQPKPENSSPP